jgi:hypothetical protein
MYAFLAIPAFVGRSRALEELFRAMATTASGPRCRNSELLFSKSAPE